MRLYLKLFAIILIAIVTQKSVINPLNRIWKEQSRLQTMSTEHNAMADSMAMEIKKSKIIGPKAF